MFGFNNGAHSGLTALSGKLKPGRWGLKGVRQISWQALLLLVMASLLISLVSLGLPAAVLAQHEGEQTAKLLPPDTDLYFTINLDPSGDQSAKFWTFLNNWWQDPNVQAKWTEFMSDIDDESAINIEEDVLPWLGPEIAMGMRNLVPAGGEEPEMILFIGTMDKEASDAFFFDKWVPFIAGGSEELPTGPSGDYNGIDILYVPETGNYHAFPEEYIMWSNNQTFLEESLDLISTPNVSASLAGTPNFQDAQAALPAERVGMFYCNCESIWGQIVAQIPPEGQPLIEAFSDYVPSCFAASIYFTSNGISTTVYYPLPEGMTLPTTEPHLLQSTKIVPGDALLFSSAQDMNASWQQIRSLIAENWEAFPFHIEEPDLPEGMTMDDIASLDAIIGWIDQEIGINVDSDIFGWMTGEYAFALLPLTFGESGPEFPDGLFLFEVENASEVQGHLTAIIGGINTIIEQSTPEGETPDTLQTSTTSIDGVNATLVTKVTNNAIAEAGLSPGYLFLDVDTTHYLVIGTTTGALEEAVKASKGEIPSLDDAEEYQGVLSLLPETKMSLGYFNISQILNTIVSQMPTGEMSEEELADFNLLLSCIPLQCALGYSQSLVDTDAVIMTGALYMLPPPLIEQGVPQGTSTVAIPEQLLDFSKSKVNPDVGRCAVSIDVDIANAPAGANIKLTAMEELSAEVTSGFELAATDAKLSIVNVAYGIRVDKTSLTADNIGTATITMKVNRNWADNYGIDNIKIFRISDGTREVLPTTFSGYDGDYAVFVGTSAGGLSTFGLAAVSPLSTAFTMSSLGISPSEVKTGESVTITATVNNTSIVTGTYTVSLKLDGTVVDTKQVPLAGGASENVSFTVTKDTAGTYSVAVDGLSGNFTVSAAEEAPTPGATNWALIGGIIGGVIVVAAVVAVILLRRRRTAA